MSRVRLISWNINGIRAAEKAGFLNWLWEEKPDVLCLQETRAGVVQICDDVLRPSGYHTYWNCAVTPGYSGTALFSREEPMHVSFGNTVPQFDNEGRVIIAEYPDVFIVNCYCPNGNRSEERLQYKMQFYMALLEVCQGMNREGKGVILCGDINTAHKELDLAAPAANQYRSGFLLQERQWVDELVSSGFVDTLRMFYPGVRGLYTWWAKGAQVDRVRSGWRYDYVFVSSDAQKYVSDAFILEDIRLSDHVPIGVELSGLRRRLNTVGAEGAMRRQGSLF